MGIENPFSQTLGIFTLHHQQWIYGLIFHFRSQIYKVTINFPLLISDYIFLTYVWVEKVWNIAIVTSVSDSFNGTIANTEFLSSFSFWKPILPHLSVCKAQLTLALEKVGPWDSQDPIRTYCERIPQFVDRHKLVFAIGNLLWDKT